MEMLLLLLLISDVSEHVVVDLVQKEDDSPQLPMEAYNFGDNLLRIRMPGEQVRVTSNHLLTCA